MSVEALRDRLRTIRRGRSNLFVYVVLAIIVVLVVLPLLTLVLASLLESTPRVGQPLGDLTLENYRALLSSRNVAATRNSLVIGVFGAGIAVLMGGGLAWLAARTDIRFRGAIELIAIAPLFLSPLVGALAWSLLASPRAGFLNVLVNDLGLPFTINIYSTGGIIFVLSLFYAPYSFLFINGALTLVNPEMEEAARVHGASNRSVARMVTFPLIRPALVGSALLTFMLVIENFAVSQVLGMPDGIFTVPSRIFALMTSANPSTTGAAAVGIQLLIITTILVLIGNRLLRGRDFTTVTGKGFRPRRITLTRGAKITAWVLVGFYFTVSIVLPVAALLQTSLRPFMPLQRFTDLFTTDFFSLNAFQQTFDYGPLWLGLRNSLLVALMTAILGGALHFSMALITRLRDDLPARGIKYLAMFPAAIPGLVLGMGFLWTWINMPGPIYGTIFVIVAAYLARFMPEGYRGISSTIGQIHSDIEDSAIVAGASRLRTTWNITLPLVKTGVISTLLLLFIISMRELSVALFLFTSQSRILSIVLYEQWESGSWARVSAIALFYVVLLLIPTLIARRWFGYGKTQEG